MRKRYVLIAIFNSALTHTACIVKLKGPTFLLNKLTFPGGQVEQDESFLQAAVRELKEEVGISVAHADLQQFNIIERTDAEVVCFTAVSNELFLACQCDDEPVFIVNVASSYVQDHAGEFVPDFGENLASAITKLREIV